MGYIEPSFISNVIITNKAVERTNDVHL